MASTSTSEIRHFIDGQFVASGQGRFDDINPVNGECIAQVWEAGRDEVDRAVRAAKKALHGPWARLSAEQRGALLVKVSQRINERFDEFLAAEITDTGKPKSLASHIDIPRGAANFAIFAEMLKNLPAESWQMATPDGAGAVNYTLRTPRGVIGVICPWNLPLLLMTWKVAPALACGNTVVVKPSEDTPATATLLGEVMNEVGIPPGVYNVVHGLGPDSAGQYLTEHPDVAGITFTGETRTGEIIMQAAARGVRPVSMELGGKNAGLVFADADMDRTIEGVMRSCFANCGQVCLGTERLYVQRPVFDRFIEALVAKAKTLRHGDPWDATTTIGPLVSQEHRNKVLSYYKAAKDAGATVLLGGGVPSLGERFDKGSWIEPTIWTGLPEDAKVVREEIFGPCTHIQPFDDEDEAVAMANDTKYGLATSIWTENVSRAHRVAARVEVGIAWVNSWFLRDLRTPFGGAKASGVGREGGNYAFEFYTEARNVCIKL
jgi:aminomuconate-semialdehyde/2-hydroxymuconate-6-semialdehyde dehydrogenase